MGFLSEHKQLLDGQKELLRQLKEVLQRRREELTHIMAEKKAIGTFPHHSEQTDGTNTSGHHQDTIFHARLW